MIRQSDLFENSGSSLPEALDYPSFREMLTGSNCRKCPLWKSRTAIVVDRGEPAGKIMIIGEAPGEQEDRQGMAFVGRSGKLLDQLLGNVGLDPSRDLLIANIVKCRPPKNRAPSKDEARTCLPYLNRQISLVKPYVLILLGAVSARYLLPAAKGAAMKDMVGEFFSSDDYPGVEIMVMYHPAFILRDPRRKPEALAHFKALRKHLRKTGTWPGD